MPFNFRSNLPVIATETRPAIQAHDPGPKPTMADPCDLDLTCPITVDLFEDPVICNDDQHTYEKAAIIDWVHSNANPTSPMTRVALTSARRWKQNPTKAPPFWTPNIEMSKRVKAFKDDEETFHARVASWEEAQQRFAEDQALLAAIEASKLDAPADTSPSAPPYELMLRRTSATATTANRPHRWMQDGAAPFGRVDFGKSSQKQTGAFYAQKSQQIWNASDPVEAVRWLEKAIQRAPENTEHVRCMVRWLRSMAHPGWATQALKWLHHGVRTRPEDCERNYDFGMALLEQHRFIAEVGLEDAGWYLQRARDLWAPHHVDQPLSRIRMARFNAALGDYHAQAGDIETAHNLFKLAENDHRGNLPYMQRLGDSYLRKAQRYGVAATDSDEAREALKWLGEASQKLQAELKNGVDKGGVNSRALAACSYSLGEAYMWKGDDKAAAKSFREALGRSSQNGVYHGSLADALRNLGEVEAARTSYFTAARLDPKCGRYEYELSILDYRSGNHERAIITADKAAQKSPQNALYASHAATLKAQQTQSHIA